MDLRVKSLRVNTYSSEQIVPVRAIYSVNTRTPSMSPFAESVAHLTCDNSVCVVRLVDSTSSFRAASAAEASLSLRSRNVSGESGRRSGGPGTRLLYTPATEPGPANEQHVWQSSAVTFSAAESNTTSTCPRHIVGSMFSIIARFASGSISKGFHSASRTVADPVATSAQSTTCSVFSSDPCRIPFARSARYRSSYLGCSHSILYSTQAPL